MERETFEETGYKIQVVPGSLFNVVEYKETEYLIISGMAFLENLKAQNEGRPDRDLVIQQKLYSLNHHDPNSLWKTDDSEFIPGLKDIVQKFLYTYQHKKINLSCILLVYFLSKQRFTLKVGMSDFHL